MHNPFKIVSDFEETVAKYTGARFAVSTDSCTSAIFLCLKYLKAKGEISIPSGTYISPAMAIIHAGCEVVLRKENWTGQYQLAPYPIYDAAKRFTSGMYFPKTFVCLSFHIKKHLKLGKGGMILTDDERAVEWLQKASYEGRSRKSSIHQDNITTIGWNMYMTPQEAAHGLALMQNYPDHVRDLPNAYRDLSTFEIFKNCKRV